jgi:polyisoprenoid-binding protein YceI
MRLTHVLLVGLPLIAQEREFRIQPAEGARLGLIVEKTRLLSGKKHDFTWQAYTGVVRFDPSSPASGKVRLSVDAASLQCHDTWISESDKKKVLGVARKDMLGLPQHAEIRFESRRIDPESGGFRVVGDLTIRGIARPVVLAVKLLPVGEAIWVEGHGIVKLTDYGLKPPSAALGAVGTKNEMQVSFRVRAELVTPQRSDAVAARYRLLAAVFRME